MGYGNGNQRRERLAHSPSASLSFSQAKRKSRLVIQTLDWFCLGLGLCYCASISLFKRRARTEETVACWRKILEESLNNVRSSTTNATCYFLSLPQRLQVFLHLNGGLDIGEYNFAGKKNEKQTF